MANELKDKRVAFLFTEGAEQLEVTEPLETVRRAGADTEIISLKKGEVEMREHFDKGDKITADKTGRRAADPGWPRRPAARARRSRTGRHPRPRGLS